MVPYYCPLSLCVTKGSFSALQFPLAPLFPAATAQLCSVGFSFCQELLSLLFCSILLFPSRKTLFGIVYLDLYDINKYVSIAIHIFLDSDFLLHFHKVIYTFALLSEVHLTFLSSENILTTFHE